MNTKRWKIGNVIMVVTSACLPCGYRHYALAGRLNAGFARSFLLTMRARCPRTQAGHGSAGVPACGMQRRAKRPLYGTMREERHGACQALSKYVAWMVYVAFRRRGRLRSHVCVPSVSKCTNSGCPCGTFERGHPARVPGRDAI